MRSISAAEQPIAELLGEPGRHVIAAWRGDVLAGFCVHDEVRAHRPAPPPVPAHRSPSP